MNKGIEEKIISIKENISKSCIEVLKDPNSINIVLATKNQVVQDMKMAKKYFNDAVFAENTAQEFRDKFDIADVWDFIGKLQSNKVKYLVGKVRLIQSVDRIEVCDEIERLCVKNSIKQEILIEVNMGRETAKGGVDPNVVLNFYNKICLYKNIVVRGLMIVTPKTPDIDYKRSLFRDSKWLFNSLNLQDDKISYLSMGMSDDYNEAIKEGANMIRLGRAVFGNRN